MFISDTVAVSVYLRPTVINVSAHLFHPEIGNTVIPVIHVLIDPTHVRVATVASNDAIVCSHIYTDSRWEYIHCITNSRTAQRHLATSSQETRQSNGTPGLQLSRNIQFHFRVVGARDANHVLIRVRHHSRTFVSFPRSMCNAEFLQTILDLVLQLVDLILILELLCLLHHSINYGLRQLPSSSGMAIQSDSSLAYTFKFFLRFSHADWR